MKERKNRKVPTTKKTTDDVQKNEEYKEAQHKLDTEMVHQRDEAETRALCDAMLADASSNSQRLNSSCSKLLTNFQGNNNYC